MILFVGVLIWPTIFAVVRYPGNGILEYLNGVAGRLSTAATGSGVGLGAGVLSVLLLQAKTITAADMAAMIKSWLRVAGIVGVLGLMWAFHSGWLASDRFKN